MKMTSQSGEKPMTFDEDTITPHGDATEELFEAELRHSRMQRILDYLPPDGASIDPFKVKNQAETPTEKQK